MSEEKQLATSETQAAVRRCQLREAAQTRINELCARHGIRVPTLVFNLRGRSAGRADLRRHHIRLNPLLFRENYHAFLSLTIPHELCHLWQHQLGLSGRMHGRELQRLMRRMGIDDPCRTHSYDTSRAGVRRTRRFAYGCRCRTHMISSVIHHRITGGCKYRCRRCQSYLRLTTDQ